MPSAMDIREEANTMGKTLMCVLLFVACSLLAQASQGESKDPQRAQEGQVTTQGCVTHFSGRSVLVQPRGSSYVLEATGLNEIGDYLGQEVEVAGRESPTFSTSSSFAMDGGGVPQETIIVESITPVSKECSY
jgi:hypothetical protein